MFSTSLDCYNVDFYEFERPGLNHIVKVNLRGKRYHVSIRVLVLYRPFDRKFAKILYNELSNLSVGRGIGQNLGNIIVVDDKVHIIFLLYNYEIKSTKAS